MTYHYLETEVPTKCPKCASDRIGKTDSFEDYDSDVKTYTCDDCDFSWNEVYIFHSWHEVE